LRTGVVYSFSGKPFRVDVCVFVESPV
jgi:hypothetical protein